MTSRAAEVAEISKRDYRRKWQWRLNAIQKRKQKQVEEQPTEAIEKSEPEATQLETKNIHPLLLAASQPTTPPCTPSTNTERSPFFDEIDPSPARRGWGGRKKIFSFHDETRPQTQFVRPGLRDPPVPMNWRCARAPFGRHYSICYDSDSDLEWEQDVIDDAESLGDVDTDSEDGSDAGVVAEPNDSTQELSSKNETKDLSAKENEIQDATTNMAKDESNDIETKSDTKSDEQQNETTSPVKHEPTGTDFKSNLLNQLYKCAQRYTCVPVPGDDAVLNFIDAKGANIVALDRQIGRLHRYREHFGYVRW